MKQNKKRFLTAVLAVVLALSVSACAANSTNNSQSAAGISSSQAQQGSSASTDSQQSEQGQEQQGNILVVYFTAAENSGMDAVASASYTTIDGQAVGRVRAVADWIAQATGGELFSIRTETVYPADGAQLIDYAAQEQDENARPVLTSHIENLDAYDTIFIGYPNWWADMPQALYSFFDEYDFSGKTIIPFNVHNGSRFSRTIETIEELEPDAQVVADGFTVSEQNVAQAQADVTAWLEELGY